MGQPCYMSRISQAQEPWSLFELLILKYLHKKMSVKVCIWQVSQLFRRTVTQQFRDLGAFTILAMFYHLYYIFGSIWG